MVAPGSVHINGTTYVFINPECEPQPVPDWVAPWVASRSGRTKVPPNDNPSSFGPRPDYLKNLTRTSHSWKEAPPHYTKNEAVNALNGSNFSIQSRAGTGNCNYIFSE